MSPERAAQEESAPGRKAQARRSASLLKSRLLKEEQTAFGDALRSFATNPAFERMAAIIARSRRRFILGRGDAQEHAMLLSASLKASFSQVFLVAPPGLDHLDLLADVRTGDVLIAICHRPYRRDTVEIGRLYVAAGGTLMLLTDSADSPLSAFASEQIIIEHATRDAQVDATAVVLATRLLARLASASSKGAVRRAQERERLGDLLGLYESDMRWVGREQGPGGAGS